MENHFQNKQKRANGSSPAAVRMRRQTTGVITDHQNNPQPTTFSSQIRIQTQNSHRITQMQSQSQFDMDHQHTQMSQSLKAEYAEMEAKLAPNEKTIEIIRKKYEKIRRHIAALKKCMGRENKMMDELIEKQNLFTMHSSLVKEEFAALKETSSELEKRGDDLERFYNNEILKLDEEAKGLKERLDNEDLNEGRELAEQVRLKNEELVLAGSKYQQLKNDATEMTKIVDEIEGKAEQFDRMIREDQQRHEEEIKKLSQTGENIKADLDSVREEESELLVRHDDNLKRFEEFFTKFQALGVKSTEGEKQIEYLESSVQGLQETNANLISQLEQLKSIQVALISERDSELAVDRKKLQDLLLKSEETMNKLSKTNSSNKELSDTVAKVVQHNEELKRDLLNKSDEKTKLKNALDNASETNAELSSETQRLDEELIARKIDLMQTEADLENYDTTQDESCKKESELGERLAIAKQELQNKIDEKAKLGSKMRDEKLSSIQEAEELKLRIELQNKQITGLGEAKEKLLKEEKNVISENERKLQQLTQLPMQCQKGGHEKRIKEQNMKIDYLRHQIQAEKLGQKQENILRTKNDRKEKDKRKAENNELQSEIDNMKKAISETADLMKDLEKLLKKAPTSEETYSKIIEESLNSSQLFGSMFAKHESLPTSSTPENSLLQGQKQVPFELASFSDLSSIDGSDIFEAARRNYAEFLKNNRTDSAKLGKHGMENKS